MEWILNVRERSYNFIPPSKFWPADTVMALLVDTAPDELGNVVVMPVGVVPLPAVVVVDFRVVVVLIVVATPV